MADARQISKVELMGLADGRLWVSDLPGKVGVAVLYDAPWEMLANCTGSGRGGQSSESGGHVPRTKPGTQ